MNTKERAQKIRDALNAKGWNSRKVSVRASDYSEIVFTIRDLSVDFATVQEIAESFERIRRCEISGDILGGGNTYVTVRFDEDVFAPVVASYRAEIDKLAEGESVQIEGVDVLRCDRDSYRLTRFVDGETTSIGRNLCWWGASGAAEGLLKARKVSA